MGPIEEKSATEKGKKPVKIAPPHVLKFMIFSNDYFFRVFDIKMRNFFPIEVKPREGIFPKNKDEFEEIQSMSAFKNFVYNCLNSDYIKDVLRYMTEDKK